MNDQTPTASSPAPAEASVPFSVADANWERVSPRLTTARRIVVALCVVPVIAAAVVVWLGGWIQGYSGGWCALVVGTAVAVYSWLHWMFGRRTRSWGYLERSDELFVVRGFLFRRLSVVPYGRMQMVDVKAGPVDRALGINTVQLHTAAATSDAGIPGLPPEVATSLRDRLAALGEQRQVGL